MKKNLTISLLLICSLAHAQTYFQHWYNRSNVFANMKFESFYDGIRTRANYAGGNPLTYYNVGYGATFLAPIGAFVTDDARFVRTNKPGTVVNVNIGTNFADVNTILFHNTHGRAICEINNGLGTGGYLCVGNVESNPITGSVVPGFSDGLFYKINNAGAVGSKFRFDVTGRADYFTDIIASKAAPGTYYVCGYTSNSNINDACIVMSIQSNGTVNWFKTYQFDPTWPAGSPASAYCRAYGIAEDINSGNLVVVGSFMDSIPGNPNGNDGLVFYLTPAGAVICAQAHNIFIDDQYQDVIQKANGDFAICGFAGDGNPAPPAAFYHVLLTEMNPNCGVISVRTYTHVLGALFTQSKGYALIERKNLNNNYEYFITGPDYNPAASTNSVSLNKINVGGVPVAWYSYAPQSGISDNGYGIDYADAAATKPGVTIFSNTNGPAITNPFDDSYMLKTYFNGATCTNYCPNNTLIVNNPPFNIIPLPNAKDTLYKRKGLVAATTNYIFGVICNQNVVGCGSNARDGSDGNELYMPEVNSFNLFPNPADDIINIAINIADAGLCTVEVVDVTGRVTLLNDQFLTKGEQVVMADISSLASGIYTMIIRSDKHTMTKKLIVQ